MPALIRMLVALEVLLLPAWAGAVFVRRGRPIWPRLARAPAAVVLATGPLVILAAIVGSGMAAGVLRAQAVAVAFLWLLCAVAAVVERAAGPRTAQMAAALVGWGVVGSVLVAGPVVGFLDDPAKAWVVKVAVHANPLVVAAHELGLDWLHQDRTYRLTLLGESYGYLIGGLAWWKTLLVYLFVGSGLLVFGVGRRRAETASSL